MFDPLPNNSYTSIRPVILFMVSRVDYCKLFIYLFYFRSMYKPDYPPIIVLSKRSFF